MSVHPVIPPLSSVQPLVQRFDDRTRIFGFALLLLLPSGCALQSEVARRDADLERRMERSFDDRLSADRQSLQDRISKLEANLAARNTEYSALAERLSTSEERLAELARLLLERLDGLAKGSAEMRSLAQRLDSQIDRLPLETLQELRTAIENHVASETGPNVAATWQVVQESANPPASKPPTVADEWDDASPGGDASAP